MTELKDIGNEELLNKIDDGDNQDIFAELLFRLTEGEKDRKNLEQVCYLAVCNSIISRWKCAEMLGINLADLDNWLDDHQAKKDK